MTYLLSFDFYSLSWLWWLVSGLLGLLAGYLIWARWKSKYHELEGKHHLLSNKSSKLEAELKENQHTIAILDGDIATANGRVREMEAIVKEAKKTADKTDDSPHSEQINKLKEEVLEMTKALEHSKQMAEITKSDLKASDNTNKKWEAEIVELRHELNGLKTANVASKIEAAEKAKTSSKKAAVEKPIQFDFSKLSDKNLQIVEGIGPKMELVLQEAGVNTWSDLANKSEIEVREILDSHGDKYKMINPESWALQAGLASTGQWKELITLQKQLDTGTDSNIDMTESKLEKSLNKTMKSGFGKFKENDLMIVEGIGPKIAELLNINGITTWKGLSDTPSRKIKSMLEGAGSRFSLANPITWPKQAALAAAGNWEELAKLQDELNGGV